MKDKIIKISIISLITLLILSFLSLSYAYFSLLVNGKSNNMITKMGSLRLKYVDEEEINFENAFPGDSITKSVTVTNVGSLNVSYNLVWEELQNTFINDELLIEASCVRLNEQGLEEGTCENVDSIPVNSGKIKPNVTIEPNITHKYDIKITFIETGSSQNYNKKANFTGKIGLSEGVNNTPIYCYFDGDIVDGYEYVNGQYTYRYNQVLDVEVWEDDSHYNQRIPATFMSNNINNDYKVRKLDGSVQFSWIDKNLNGWGVSLTNRKSNDPITTRMCTYINDVPVVSMDYTFAYSSPDDIDLRNINTSNIISMKNTFNNTYIANLDLSGFDTSNVVDMSNMFSNCGASTINVSGFDTSKVKDMGGMFSSVELEKLDISNFDTSNVISTAKMFSNSYIKKINIDTFKKNNLINMQYMFYRFYTNQLDLSSFDTSKVTNMDYLFSHAGIGNINLKNFNTSNITNMSYMFEYSNFDTLDLSSFDTSKVVNMSKMFNYSEINNLNISNFDTKNVTNMESMFRNSSTKVIDVSNFNTSNVTNMGNMFSSTVIETLDLSNFDTSKVTDMQYMFSQTKIKSLDLSSFNTSNVTHMGGMFYNSSSITSLNISSFDTSKVTIMYLMFSRTTFDTIDISNFDTRSLVSTYDMFRSCPNLVTIYVSDKFTNANITSSSNMFTGSTKLVGGAGTKYSSSRVNSTYARIDGGTSSPGYFTLKNN